MARGIATMDAVGRPEVAAPATATRPARDAGVGPVTAPDAVAEELAAPVVAGPVNGGDDAGVRAPDVAGMDAAVVGPTEEAPTEEAPTEADSSVSDAPVDTAPVDSAPVDTATVDGAPDDDGTSPGSAPVDAGPVGTVENLPTGPLTIVRAPAPHPASSPDVAPRPGPVRLSPMSRRPSPTPRPAPAAPTNGLAVTPPVAPAPAPHVPRPAPVPAPQAPAAPPNALSAVPSPRDAGPATASGPAPVDPAEAEEFLRLFHEENPGAGPVEPRLARVLDEVARTGTYVHTHPELEYGARVAWRNSARCIGRLYWRSLHLRDRRHVTAPQEVADECVGHLRDATRRGRIRSTITVFAPDTPAAPGPRVWNEQLVRYAGYRAGGSVLGDPRYMGFTDTARSLGWIPPSPMGRFDVLPLIVTGGGEHAAAGPQWSEVPADAVLEVPLHHPDHAWFADLGLRWHALPAISNMKLDIGGVSYPTAPFNGWYMATEIGARNLADNERYDLLREVAEAMGLDTASDRTLWRDRAAVELTLAVQHSFDTAGVSLADHHGESQRFLRHVEREEAAGRSSPVDWSWIVPPISGGLTPVFHRYYDEPTDTGPMFRMDPQSEARGRGCPM